MATRARWRGLPKASVRKHPMVHQPPDPFVAPRGVVAYVRIAEAAGGLPLTLYLRNDGTAPRDRTADARSGRPASWAPDAASPGGSDTPLRAGDRLGRRPGRALAPPFFAVGARGFTD
jgi:4-hydroxy-tetrahydrodipicolinate synthase